MDQKKFYVYVDVTKDTGKPFYIGKGSGKRVDDFDRNPLHKNISEKHGIIREIIYETFYEDAAFETEIRLIEELETYALLGKGGANLTLGGEGCAGFTMSDEAKKRISAGTKKSWENPEYREKISETLAIIVEQKWNEPEFKEMMLSIRKDPEFRKKISTSVKELWQDPEYVERVNKARNEVQSQPDFNRKISEGILSKSTYEQRSEKSKKMWSDPERSEKLREISREKFKDPEFRAKMAEAQKKRWEKHYKMKEEGLLPEPKKRSKETRRKISEKVKSNWEIRKLKEGKES